MHLIHNKGTKPLSWQEKGLGTELNNTGQVYRFGRQIGIGGEQGSGNFIG